MPRKEFNIDREIPGGEPNVNPLSSRLEKNADGSLKLPDFTTLAQTTFDKKEVLQTGKRFTQAARSEGAKDIGNIISEFTKWRIEYYELISNQPKFDTSNSTERIQLINEWTLRIFHAQLRLVEAGRNVLRQLHKYGLFHYDSMLVNDLPDWLCLRLLPSIQEYGNFTEIDEKTQVFAMLNEYAIYHEQGEDEEYIESYKSLSAIFHKLLRHPSATEFGMYFLTVFTMVEKDFNRIYRKYFLDSKDKSVTRIYHLLSDFVLQTYHALMDEQDPRHAASRRFVTDFTESPIVIGSKEEKIQKFTLGAIKFGMTNNLDEVSFIKNVQAIGDDNDDEWYNNLAESMSSIVEKTSKIIIYKSEDLTSYFLEPHQWSDEQWQNLDGLCNELGISEKSVYLEQLDHPQLSRPLDSVTAKVKKEKDVLFGQLFFVRDKEAFKNESMDSMGEPAFSLVTFAIDLQSEHPALYVRLLEEESIDESLQASILSLTHQLLQNTLRSKNEKNKSSALVENTPSQIQPYDISRVKQKGPQQMARGKHKRPKKQQDFSSDENGEESRNSRSFMEEIEQRRLWPKFILSAKMLGELQEKFNDSDIQRIQQKLNQANHGAGLVKTYLYLQGPRNQETVWAIRLNRQVRILAQEGIKKGAAHVFAVEFKSEIEKR